MTRSATWRAASWSAAVLAIAACGRPADPPLELFPWERGIAVRARGAEPMAMYLWFYEWSLFDGLESGQWAEGRHDFAKTVAADGRSARIDAGAMVLEARVVEGGVELELELENRTGRDWPEPAALIACFNPGPEESRTFEMGHHRATFLLGRDGLERFADRAMHFAADAKPALERLSPELRFPFSERWETSPQDCVAGLLLRESLSGGWTSGVAWSDSIGVQAHNPWLCMHVATKVGPLAAGARKTLRGKLYLFQGTPDDGLRRYREDFPR